jgi:hypothetical protein
MTPRDEDLDQLARDLERATEGLSPLESALIIAEAFRVTSKTNWEIDMHSDGGFTIRPTS